MSKTLAIAKRDFLQNVRKPTFWISLLIMPVIFLISFLVNRNTAMQEMASDKAVATQKIAIVDESGYIDLSLVQQPYRKINEMEEAKNLLAKKEIEAVFHYPKELTPSTPIEILTGPKPNTGLSNLASTLLQKSLALEINDQNKRELLLSPPKAELKNIEEIGSGPKENKSFLTGVGVTMMFVYMVIVILSVGPLLVSFTEEKENKVMEIIISLVKPIDYIKGKLLGNIGLITIQIVVIGFFGLMFVKYALPSDVIPQILGSFKGVDLWLVLKMIFYLVSGFLITAAWAIGTSAALPSTKEAQSFSSVFIILSMLPFYFMGSIITQSAGQVIIWLSYFPFTAPLILMFRTVLGEISLQESIISTAVVIIYVIISFLVAAKFFQIGAVEYNKRISLKTLLHRKEK